MSLWKRWERSGVADAQETRYDEKLCSRYANRREPFKEKFRRTLESLDKIAETGNVGASGMAGAFKDEVMSARPNP